jgi:hypothetical protein
MWVLTTLGVEALPVENIRWYGYLGGVIAISGVILVVATHYKKENLS